MGSFIEGKIDQWPFISVRMKRGHSAHRPQTSNIKMTDRPASGLSNVLKLSHLAFNKTIPILLSATSSCSSIKNAFTGTTFVNGFHVPNSKFQTPRWCRSVPYYGTGRVVLRLSRAASFRMWNVKNMKRERRQNPWLKRLLPPSQMMFGMFGLNDKFVMQTSELEFDLFPYFLLFSDKLLGIQDSGPC